MKILVLSGGGSKGAYEAGFIYKTFNDIEFDKLYGTSVGSLNCILLAQCYINKNPDLLKEVWSEHIQDNKDIYNKSYFKTIFGWGTPPFDFKPLKKIIKKYIEFDKIIKINKEIRITSVDLVSGNTIFASNSEISNEEELLDYTIASASIPPLFPAVKIGYSVMVDGGIRDNIPTKLLLKEEYKEGDKAIIILCNPEKIETQSKKYEKIQEIGLRSIEIMSHEINLNDINMIKRINELIKDIPKKEQNEWLLSKKTINIEVIMPENDLGDVLSFKKEHLFKCFQKGVEDGEKAIKNKLLI